MSGVRCVAMSYPGRRFPPPWSVHEHAESYSVRDASGFPIAYVYFSDRPTTDIHSERMTKDQARRVAVNIAKLPGLLNAPPSSG